MPSEVPQQPLGLVTGAQGKRKVRSRKVKQRNHAHARHHVAEARCIGLGIDCLGVPIHRSSDVNRLHLDAERFNHQVCVFQALGARRCVRHANSDDVFLSQRAGGQIRRQRRIYATRQRHDAFLKTPPDDDLLAKEGNQPPFQQFCVDC